MTAKKPARQPASKTPGTQAFKAAQKEEVKASKIELKTIYTFMFSRNIYTVRMDDIKKVTLLEHKVLEKKDDIDEVKKVLYIFSVTGNQIPGVFDEDKDGNNKPVFETIMEVKAEEDDYSTLYGIYEDLVIKWDKYQIIKTEKSNS